MLNKTAAAQQAPLQPVHYPSAPWEKIGIDFVEMFSRSSYAHRIRNTRNSLYYPQANGEDERFSRGLIDCIQAADVAHEGRVDAVQYGISLDTTLCDGSFTLLSTSWKNYQNEIECCITCGHTEQ
ncbi:hypothetical protein M513_13510 [Trichuris suis]|uniref:Uncharacterized protein n=1 Tax=Trichuris suis TaxID=68888 RepID=A0A085LJ67_9BILA|nr:hypothetical protein M513_14111 [Trichuris suis]KFD45618.1 hypothetical protein M513_13510 [Trichuris suis]